MPVDPQVAALLDEALALDPLGLDAWRRWRDRAQVAALQGDAETAGTALVEALLMRPDAATELARRGSGRELQLLPAGEGQPAVSLADVLDEIERRREELTSLEPAASLRLRVREVEVLAALEQWSDAWEAAQRLLADEPLYLDLWQARLAVARGDLQTALPLLEELSGRGHFWIVVYLMDALSRSPVVDGQRFAAAEERALAIMAQGGADVVFDRPSLLEMLAARQRLAERRGHAVEALQQADAVAFASR